MEFDIELAGMKANFEEETKEIDGVEYAWVKTLDLRKLHHWINSGKRYIKHLEDKISVQYANADSALRKELATIKATLKSTNDAHYQKDLTIRSLRRQLTDKEKEKDELKARLFDYSEQLEKLKCEK